MDERKNRLIIILYGILIIITITEIIFRVSNTDRFEEDEYLCHVLRNESKLIEPWLEKDKKIKVHYTRTFLDFGYMETPFLAFRFLSFLISFICSYFIKIIFDTDTYSDYSYLTYYLCLIILINLIGFGVLTWCINIVRIFVFITNNMLNKRFILRYEDQVSKKNGIYCFICDIFIFIVLCVICIFIDYIDNSKGEKIENVVKNIQSSNFHHISSNDISTVSPSNKIEIEELDSNEKNFELKNITTFHSKDSDLSK